jgi:hypothetical protein
MRLRYRTSGGIAGRLRGVEIDSASLAADEAAELARLVADARRCVAAGPDAATDDRARDRIEYEIEVDASATQAAWRVRSASPGAELTALLAWLEPRARIQRPD